MDKVRVSRTVIRLIDAGNITRDSDPRDRRRAMVTLTPEGLDLYHRIVPLMQDFEENLTSDFKQDERRNFDGALSKLEAYAKKDGADVRDEAEKS